MCIYLEPIHSHKLLIIELTINECLILIRNITNYASQEVNII